MKIFKQKQLSSFQKWRQLLRQKDWGFTINAVRTAETFSTEQAIHYFQQLLKIESYNCCSKRFYIKRHLSRFKQSHNQTGI